MFIFLGFLKKLITNVIDLWSENMLDFNFLKLIKAHFDTQNMINPEECSMYIGKKMHSSAYDGMFYKYQLSSPVSIK